MLQLELVQLLAQMGKVEQARRQSAIWSSAVRTTRRRSMPSSGLRCWHTISTRPRRAPTRLSRFVPSLQCGYLYQGTVAEERKHPEDALALVHQGGRIFSPDTAEPLEAAVRLLVA